MQDAADRSRYDSGSFTAADQVRQTFQAALDVEPESLALRFDGRSYSRAELRAAVREIADMLAAAGLCDGAPVAWLARNSPELIAASLALLTTGRTMCVVNPHETPGMIAARLRDLAMPAVVGVAQDWSSEVREAVAAYGGVGLRLDLDADRPAQFVEGLAELGAGPFRSLPSGTTLELITSGTTGDPKRIPISAERFLKGIAWGTRRELRDGPRIERPPGERSPALLFAPFSHASGVFLHLLAIKEARPIVLRERFRAEHWLEDVRMHRPKVSNLVPAAIAMVMASDATRDDLSSLIVVRSGTAPLDPNLRLAFEERFGVPVLLEYGASEFIGGITVWTLADYARHKKTKAASVGRPKPDVEVRIVNPQTGEPEPVGQVGALVLKSDRIGPDWVRTTDLASLDDDGFLYIHGRLDQAINRGGFKILPESVAQVLRRHPSVREVVILGARDAVLGQVPIAAVELKPDAGADALESLRAFAAGNLAKYQMPVAFELFDVLPRTQSLKVSLPGIKQQLAGRYAF